MQIICIHSQKERAQYANDAVNKVFLIIYEAFS